MSVPAAAPEVVVDGRVTVIALGPKYKIIDEHSLDSGLGETLIEIAVEATPPLVVLDLSETQFFGSSFIEVLFRVWNRLQGRSGRLRHLWIDAALLRRAEDYTSRHALASADDPP